MVRRNDPCPCGSGKKYKYCCLSKEQTFMERQETPNMATDVLNKLKAQVGDSAPSSLEELNKLALALMDKQNQSPKTDFLGLSSDQMHLILHNPLLTDNAILSLSEDKDFDCSMLSEVPVIRQALFLMTAIGKSEKGIKATKIGNIPRALVQSFYKQFEDKGKNLIFLPKSQTDVIILDMLLHVLKETGLIKLRTGWISLTKKGQTAMIPKNHLSLYNKLFYFYGIKLNWLVMYNGIEGFEIIQQALSFNLYILKQKATGFIPQQTIVDLFQRAFPQEGEVKHPFVVMFLDNFCHYFGLVERNKERALFGNLENLNYRTSPLFSGIIEWKI